MKHYKVKSYAKQAGMTLIELSVVLLILVGLAGLLIPYVGSFTQNTHDSTNSNNLAQLNNAMGRYVSEKNKLPPHTDLLTNGVLGATGTGTCAGAPALGEIYCGLANPALFTAGQYLASDAATLIQRTSLANSGINMAVANDPNVENKTFGTSTGMYMLNSPTAMGWATAYFAKVATDGTSIESHLAKALGRDKMVYNSTCYDYIGVGLGDNNELIQSTATNAPVYFPQDAELGPTQRYAHFIAILQVDKDNTTANCSGTTEKAKFLGVVANVPSAESPTLVGVGSLLEQGYTNRANGA